jgi:hypothetical protein
MVGKPAEEAIVDRGKIIVEQTKISCFYRTRSK